MTPSQPPVMKDWHWAESKRPTFIANVCALMRLLTSHTGVTPGEIDKLMDLLGESLEYLNVYRDSAISREQLSEEKSTQLMHVNEKIRNQKAEIARLEKALQDVKNQIASTPGPNCLIDWD